MSRPFALATTPIVDGPTLIEASAGTGKTWTITGLVLRLLVEHHVDGIERLLIVTFTNAATDELKVRIRAALQDALAAVRGGTPREPAFAALCAGRQDAEAILVRALRDFDRASIATIHGFCKRVLDENAFESGVVYETDLLQDDRELLREAAQDAFRRLLPDLDEIALALLANDRTTPDEGVALHAMAARVPDVVVFPPLPRGGLAAAQTALADAYRAAVDCCVDDARAALRACAFNKSGRIGDHGGIEAVLAQLNDDAPPAVRIPALLLLNEAEIEACRNKRKASGELPAPMFAASCTAFVRAADAYRHAFRCALLQAMSDRLTELVADRAVQTFDDLLRRLHRAIRDPDVGPAIRDAIRAKYSAALIDEFQDTDPAQYAIFSHAFDTAPLFLIGDPKQSIYAFRGADLRTYLAAAAATPSNRRFTLTENHRSTQAMVDAVHHLFAAPNAFVQPGIVCERITAAGRATTETLTDGGAAMQVWFVPPRPGKGAKSIAHGINKGDGEVLAQSLVAAECVRLLSSGVELRGEPLRPGSIAVLTRTNAQARDVQRALRAVSVAAIVARGDDVCRSPEAAELAVVLDAIAQPRQQRLVRAALATELCGVDAATLERLADGAELDSDGSGDSDSETADARAQWLAFASTFDLLRDAWQHDGIFTCLQRFDAAFDVTRRMLARPDGERRVTNLRHLAELLHAEATADRLSVDALRRRFAQLRDDDRVDVEARELRLESDAEAVQITTVHRSKGLQYDIVFVCHAFAMRDDDAADVPLLDRDQTPPRLDLRTGRADDDPLRVATRRDRLADDVRLLYVAVTRARHRTYLLAGAIGTDAETTGLAHALFGGVDFGGFEGALADRVKRSGGVMSMQVVAAPPPPPTPLPRPVSAARELHARTFPRRDGQLVPWRIASFTSLARGRAADAFDEAPTPVVDATPRRGIFAFPRGARAGTCLHAILEAVDFGAVDDARTAAVVASTLSAFGFDPDAQSPAVLGMLRDVVDATLPFGFRLRDVPRTRRRDEWEFFLPVEDARTSAPFAVLAAHGVELGAAPTDESLHGFLTGSVDLLVESNGRLFVLDWKSNDLGARATDYDAPRCAAAVRAHRYALQLHLYLVAVHRYLRATRADYDYERDVGGAACVFVRGVDDAGHGIHVERPTRALIDALDATLAGGMR